MMDDLLTLTKRRAFWMVVFFIAAAVAHVAVVAVTGVQEPLFLLGALAMVALGIVSGVYTLARKLFHR